MLEVLLFAQISTADHFCYMIDRGGNIIDLTSLCNGGETSAPSALLLNSENEKSENEMLFLENYRAARPGSESEYSDGRVLSSGYRYCEILETWVSPSSWLDAIINAAPTEWAEVRVRSHWTAVSLLAPIDLCP